MLTADFDRLGVRDGTRLLDMGCGGGRHAFEAWRRGATVVALDYSEGELKEVRSVLGAMIEAGEVPHGPNREGVGGAVNGDALCLPFADDTFDCVIASEVLEHIWSDTGAIAELVRVLRPGGRMAVTVPTRWPERVCWALDHNYHDTPGGHVRIFRQRDLEQKLEAAGLLAPRVASRARAALAVLVAQVRDRRQPRRHAVVGAQVPRSPRVADHQATALARGLDRALNPVLGKSLVVYVQKVDS